MKKRKSKFFKKISLQGHFKASLTTSFPTDSEATVCDCALTPPLTTTAPQHSGNRQSNRFFAGKWLSDIFWLILSALKNSTCHYRSQTKEWNDWYRGSNPANRLLPVIWSFLLYRTLLYFFSTYGSQSCESQHFLHRTPKTSQDTGVGSDLFTVL